MGDESYFDIPALQPSVNVSSSPWLTEMKVNEGESREYATRPADPRQYIQSLDKPAAGDIETWNPMDDDFACPTFNSYKYFNVLAAERPGERSPEKTVRQSPEKRAEEISLYVGNIPLGINSEGIRNLFSAVGKVQHCKICPPKDQSNDTKFGFVGFATWKDAINAIETYDGFYVGSEKKLIVKIADRKRSEGEVFAADGNGSSSDTPAQEPVTNEDSSVGLHNNDGNRVVNDNINTSPNEAVELSVIKKLPKEGSNICLVTPPRAKLPCSLCEKLCTQRCSSCKKPYCSRACQKADKKRHKLVCNFSANTKKPSKPSSPARQETVAETEPTIDYTDSDFDCIDISLDVNHNSHKATASKNEDRSINVSPSEITEVDSEYIVLKEGRLPYSQESLDQEFMAFVTAVSNANTFWAVVRTAEYPRFRELTSRMTEIREDDLVRLSVASVGYLCLTRFSEDNCWYRSRITQCIGDRMETFFVDFGNAEWKSFDDLYQLPQEFASVPAQAQQFVLNGVASETDQNTVKFLEDLVIENTFVVELVSSVSGCIPEVVLRGSDNEESINQQMIRYREELLQSRVDQSIPSGTQHNEGFSQVVSDESLCQLKEYPVDNTSYMFPTKSTTLVTNFEYGVPSSNPELSSNLSTDHTDDGSKSMNSGSEVVGTSKSNASQAIPSNITHPPRMASEVPVDILPSGEQFDILVCHLITPVSFWIWFLDSAREIFGHLTSILSETYEQSLYFEFVPIAGELIAAKFTDGLWYRAMVDCINGNSTVGVTFIDFGNSEEVSLFDIRRITDALVAIPKLATKCTLHGVADTSFSSECVQFCNELLLNKRALATLEGRVRDSLVLSIETDVHGEMRSVVDEIVEQGYLISGKFDNPQKSVVPHSMRSEEATSPTAVSVSYQYQPIVLDKFPIPSQGVVSRNRKLVSPVTKPVSPDHEPVFSSKRSSPCFSIPGSKPVSPGHPIQPAKLVVNQFPVPFHQPTEHASKPPELVNGRLANAPVGPFSKPVQLVNNPTGAVNPPAKLVAQASGLVSKPVELARQRPDFPETFTREKPNTLSASTGSEQKKATVIAAKKLPLPIVPTTAFDVVVNDVDSTDNFYVQMTDPNLVKQLHECVRKLNEYVAKRVPSKVENVTVGSLGCAKFAEDNIWYRAQVFSVSEKDFHVRFIDFGNTQSVKPDEFLEAPEFFYQLAPQAISCRLGMKFCGDRRITMRKLTCHKRMSCLVLAAPETNRQYTVSLQASIDGRCVDIAQELSKAIGQPSLSIFTEKVLSRANSASGIKELGKIYNVLILNCSHPTYFWGQHATFKNLERIRCLQDDLNNHYNNNSYPPFTPEIHSLCVFRNEGVWYRVFVKGKSSSGLLVLHAVDFGFLVETAETSLLRPLEEKFHSAAFGAVLFSLHNTEPLDGKLWSPEAIAYFRREVCSKVVDVRLAYNSKARLFVYVFCPESCESISVTLVKKGMAKVKHSSPSLEDFGDIDHRLM